MKSNIFVCDWQIAEILKDRPSWFRDCRSLEVFTMFPAGNGGTVELLYTQVNDNSFLMGVNDSILNISNLLWISCIEIQLVWTNEYKQNAFQIYAPTTLAPARDFWTLRYTTSLDNGSLVVCISSGFVARCIDMCYSSPDLLGILWTLL